MATTLYLMDLTAAMSQPDPKTLIETLSSRLSPARQEKIGKMKFTEDKLRTLGAGLLLDYGLRQQSGLLERDLQVDYHGNGKPYFPKYPGIHFNVSHSGSMVMAVLSDRSTGCDVERLRPFDERIAARFFAQEERQQLEACPTEQRDRLFVRFWTLKESFLKVTGEGMRMPLDSFSFSLTGETARLLYQLPEYQGDYLFLERSCGDYQTAACIRADSQADLQEQIRNVFFSFQNLQDVV